MNDDKTELMEPEMAERYKRYKPVWKSYDANIDKDCECIVSGCIFTVGVCPHAFSLFNTVGDCKLDLEQKGKEAYHAAG